MLVVKVVDGVCVRVIHYTDEQEDCKTDSVGAVSAAASSRDFDSSKIIEEVVSIDVNTETVELLRYSSVVVYGGRKAIDRVRSRLHERKYNLFTNNCEHLINWALTGESESDQVDTAATVGKVAAAGAVLAVVASAGIIGAVALSKLFSGKNKDSEDEDSD